MNISEKLLNWLNNEPGGIKLLNFIILSAIYYHMYLLFVFFCFPGIKGMLSIIGSLYINDVFAQFTNVTLSFFLKAFVEELIFRFIPLSLSVRIFGLSNKTLLIAMAVSLLFGYLHGNIYNIAIQGPSGLFLSIVFLKCGGFHKKLGKALLCSTLVHATMNYNILISPLIRNL